MKLVVLQHPLAQCHLTVIRQQSTEPAEFRAGIRRLTMLLACEATRQLAVAAIEVETPLARCAGQQLAARIGLVPILRAGLGMVDPLLELIPQAEVWHLGLYRDEDTAEPIQYYSKLSNQSPVDVAFVLDPMLATGGSTALACQTLKAWGAQQIHVLSVISAPEGIAAVQTRHPDVQIWTCVVDERLNERKFIVPGLGDAGDRIFNT